VHRLIRLILLTYALFEGDGASSLDVGLAKNTTIYVEICKNAKNIPDIVNHNLKKHQKILIFLV